MVEVGTFEIEYADGSKETLYCPIEVSELPADTHAAAYKNVGTAACSFLRFEIK